MMRFFFLALFLGSSLLASSIDTKIKVSKKELQRTNKRLQGVNLQLAKLAGDIERTKKELVRIQTKLKTLQTLISEAQAQYKVQIKEYEDLKSGVVNLTKKQQKLKEELLLMISRSFSKSLLLGSIKNTTQEDIIKEEILKAIQKSEDEKLKKVSHEYFSTKELLEQKKQKLKSLEQQIATYIKNKKQLQLLRKKNQAALTKLKKLQSHYDKEKEQLLRQRETLAKTLKQLQILKETARSSRASAKMKVKNYGQKSYGKLKTVRYRGPKTIPPLEKFVIIKKYGMYRDPIYNIEIPNENIELKPLVPNAKVRNVLNGKVILAKWTPHLRNVVVVKHSNNLYTIYAYIDKLSPYIKKGRRIKKGYVIGRVNTKLIFEVTKNSAHINPLDLIRVR
ncbi:membrane-bound metallopeptidase [Nitratiruptor sp. YY09-18]|nr:membrane-bound metallopeptidase [Nitratiruptor sp. YY09-18]